MTEPSVLMLACTYNRHRLLERMMTSFLDQDYGGDMALLIYNTGHPTSLGRFNSKANQAIQLINNSKDYKTGEPYTSVGNKQRDALSKAYQADIIVHSCDDDYFLPNHISKGVEGLLKSPGMMGYKPYWSWYRGELEKAVPTANTMEPSIFMWKEFVDLHKYEDNSVNFHNGWLTPITVNNLINIDMDGAPTYVYDWSGESPAWKLSGSGYDNAENFNNSQGFEKDYGDGVLRPLGEEVMNFYYNLVKK